MKFIQSLILTAMIGPAGMVSAAYAADTTPPPLPVADGHGGYKVTFRGDHLRRVQSATVANGVLSVPRSPDYRPCVFETPPAPVFHDQGFADVTFNLEANWVGFLNLQRGDESDLFTAFVNVRRGGDVERNRDYFHTGLLFKDVDYIAEDGSSHVQASTHGFTDSYVISDVAVQRDADLIVSICDVRPGAWLSVKSITIHTYPNDEE